MKKQYGKMGLGAMIGLAFLAIGAITVISAVAQYYSASKYGATTERGINAQYQDMESILASYSLKIGDAVQVPAMYRDDLKDVMTSVMTARQGPEGSKAAFQWFKEHDINIDSSMYTKIQQMIEAGRNKFENAQSKFIDSKRAYETVLEYDLLLTQGWWVKLTGYPKIDLENDYAIISSDHAKTTFKTKTDTGLKLR